MENLEPQYLEVKKTEINKKFDSLQAEVKQIEAKENALAQRKNLLNLEMLRLQGENRLLEELLGNSQPEEAAPAEPVTPQ